MPGLDCPLIKLAIIGIRVCFWELQVKVKNCTFKDVMPSRMQITSMKLCRLTACWSCRLLRFKVNCGHVVVGVAVRAAMILWTWNQGLEWRSFSIVQIKQRYLTVGPFSHWCIEALLWQKDGCNKQVVFGGYCHLKVLLVVLLPEMHDLRVSRVPN